ncbi:MAG: DNA polymerase III subunit gamma/tau [Clostridiales bacterium]|nr:DNA polymerase III subunit gamma/tau [Clostridiales bacterium]MDD7432701.1 DNA polymerase III subunit gamma/tau [Clostridiales bacterium]MDY3061159.1 DNA polymerase III subunit gamma/tau [Eubacteriales bacterium]
MGHLALYREWRPQNFDDVVGQEQVVYPLRQAVISQDIGHAYLFCGTRGTGKTSLAKIFAKAVNCLDPHEGNPCNACEICEGINKGSLLDVLEIDAASNNSVDNIRRITDEIVFTPSQAKYKVYIIDEVHMLSQGAFNALLKTLEEPPAHAIFILATTEPQRLPATIISRCQRYEFRRIPSEKIIERLGKIAEKEKIDISAEGLAAIARIADGALRDAISLLDQCSAGLSGRIEKDDVLRLSGMVQDEFIADFTEALFDQDLSKLLRAVEELQMSGRNIRRFLQDFIRTLRNLLVCKLSQDPSTLPELSDKDLKRLQNLSARISRPALMGLIVRMSALDNDLRWAGDPRTSLEIALIAEMNESHSSEAAAVPAAPAEKVVPDEAASPEETVPVKEIAPIKENIPAEEAPEDPEKEAEFEFPSEPASTMANTSSEPATPVGESRAEDVPEPVVSPAEPPSPKAQTPSEPAVSASEAHAENAFEIAPPPAEPSSDPSSEATAAVDESDEHISSEPTSLVSEPPATTASEPSTAEAETLADPVSGPAAPPAEPRLGLASDALAPVAENDAETTLVLTDPSSVPPAEIARASSPEKALQVEKEQIEAVYQMLRENYRIDLAMLLRPAEIFFAGDQLIIHYHESEKAHGRTVRQADNLSLIRSALEKAGLHARRLIVEVENEETESNVEEAFRSRESRGSNLNKEEPEWMKRLRESSRKLGIPMEVVGEEENTESDDVMPF